MTASIAYNVPKFFEVTVNETGTGVEPSKLRSDRAYSTFILWYIN